MVMLDTWGPLCNTFYICKMITVLQLFQQIIRVFNLVKFVIVFVKHGQITQPAIVIRQKLADSPIACV